MGASKGTDEVLGTLPRHNSQEDTEYISMAHLLQRPKAVAAISACHHTLCEKVQMAAEYGHCSCQTVDSYVVEMPASLGKPKLLELKVQWSCLPLHLAWVSSLPGDHHGDFLRAHTLCSLFDIVYRAMLTVSIGDDMIV